ncbi:MAG: gliding motility lipoprotein GldH [Bacteroidales bacterium]|jgi:gliding motility-associated lipoprotein GldH
MKKIIVLLLILSFSIFYSCKNVRVYNEYFKIEDNKWSVNDTIKYNIEIDDISSSYDLLLSVRYGNEYMYRNLYLFFNTLFPDSTMLTDTVLLILSDPSGKLLGKNKGHLKEAQFILGNNVSFKERGNYSFDIIHGMRHDTIEGIHEIGITVNKK